MPLDVNFPYKKAQSTKDIKHLVHGRKDIIFFNNNWAEILQHNFNFNYCAFPLVDINLHQKSFQFLLKKLLIKRRKMNFRFPLLQTIDLFYMKAHIRLYVTHLPIFPPIHFLSNLTSLPLPSFSLSCSRALSLSHTHTLN